MKFYHYDDVCYVTARQLEKNYQLSRKKCWKILSGARGYIRTTPCGLTPLYAWEDCLNFFSHLNPAQQR